MTHLTPIALIALALVLPASALAQSTSTACLPAELRAKLSKIEARFGPVKVISTHRPGARIWPSGKPSFHGRCQAVDLVPKRGTFAAVSAYVSKNWRGGVGVYNDIRFRHIHLDTGPRYRWRK